MFNTIHLQLSIVLENNIAKSLCLKQSNLIRVTQVLRLEMYNKLAMDFMKMYNHHRVKFQCAKADILYFNWINKEEIVEPKQDKYEMQY